MGKIFAVVFSLLLIFVLLLFPSKSVSAAEQPRYGYSLLTNDVQRTAYQEIVSGLKVLTPEITLSVHATESTMQSVADEVQYVINMVIKDFPELFWFRGAYNISGNGTVNDVSIIICPQYSLNGQSVTADSSQLSSAQNQLTQAISSALSTIPQNASDYDIALALHDYIINRVVYAYEGDHQTAYGALVSGKAVCAGYARAYQLLLIQAGIPCSYIEGQSYDPNGDLVNHAWNLVWLDGKCYYTDVTWDDQEDKGVFHEYLNLSKEEISDTHYLGADEVLPASCGHDGYRFFIRNTGEGVCDIRDHKEDADVAGCFQLKSLDGKKAEYYCTIHYHKDDFHNWLDAHYKNIGKELGFESVGYELVSVGHEYHLILKGTLADASPSPSVATTEPVPTQQSEPTQQTQATQHTDSPNQESSSTQPASSPTEIGQVQSPTDSTDPTHWIEPVASTDASQEFQAESKPAGSQDTSFVPTQDNNQDNSGKATVVAIGIVAGVVIVSCVASVFLYLRSRKSKF